MTDADTPIPSPEMGDDPRERSLIADLRQLAGEARAYAEAELALQKARASHAGQEAKAIALLGALALALAFFALMALVIGSLIALGPVLTAWGAMAAVTLALLLMAAMLGLLAARRAKRLAVALAAKPDEGRADA